MYEYDFIIAGCGLSGSSVLLELLDSDLKNKKILIIERDLGKQTPQWWSYWHKKNSLPSGVETKQWKQFRVVAPDFSKQFRTITHEISLIESKNYFKYIHELIENHPHVELVTDTITSIKSESNGGVVETSQKTYTGHYIFDSTNINLAKTKKSQSPVMQGLRLEIQTGKAVFDPKIVTLIDFRNSPPNQLLFMYVLPVSPTAAFIEIAHLTHSDNSFTRIWYEHILDTYIKQVLGAVGYHKEHAFLGKIPLGGVSLVPSNGEHIFRIGAKAGMIRPTTSFGFSNILKDSSDLVHSLESMQFQVKRHHPSWLEGHIDPLFLELMNTKPEVVRKMYLELFSKNDDGDTILGFLNDENWWISNIKLITKVNPTPIARLITHKIQAHLRK